MKTITSIITPFIFIPFFAHAHGGISGGGGDVMNATPPTTANSAEAVEHQIKNAKATLAAYLSQRESEYRSGQMSPEDHQVFALIFERGEVSATLQRVGLDVLDNQPCLTSFKTPVDGSIYSRKPNSICISSYSIAAKVEAQEINAQAIALMLHEYSEVMGASDDDAIQLQARTLQDF